MRKFWLWMIPLVAVTVISAGIVIGVHVNKNTENNSVIFAKDIKWNYDMLEFEEGDTIKITKNEITVEPANCTQTIVYSTNNSDILTITDPSKGEILINKAGECDLIASINTSETTKKTVKIKIVVNSNQNNTIEKTETNIYKTFQLSNGFDILQYQSESEFEDCNCRIANGNDCIKISNFAKNRIDVVFMSIGTAEIVVESQTEIIYFHITIE